MSKKATMIKKLNALKNPYNLQVDFAQGGANEFGCKVILTIMDEIKVVEGRSVQPSHRIVTTMGFGTTREDAKAKAITEALQFAGVI